MLLLKPTWFHRNEILDKYLIFKDHLSQENEQRKNKLRFLQNASPSWFPSHFNFHRNKRERERKREKELAV